MSNFLASRTTFDSADPEAVLTSCADTLGRLDISFDRPSPDRLEAEYHGVTIRLGADAGRVRIDLGSTAADPLVMVRAAVQARLIDIDPALSGLRWDGVGRAGDLAPNLSFARVEDAIALSPDFMRLTLTGSDLARFATGGLHFRLLRQLDPHQPAAWPRLAEDGSVTWPENGVQLLHKAYTSRHLDPARHQIIVDIYRHEGGPTSEWAETFPVGQALGVTGPGGGALAQGKWLLLAGDETAQPAILRMLEELPPETEGEALVLAGAPGCESPVENRTRIRLRWLYRDAGDDLCAAVEALTPPDRDDSFLWFAASKPQARRMRTHFGTTLGLDRSRFRAAGYWQ